MHCWARYLFYAVVTALAVGQMMVACGQTGPLYLPADEDRVDASAPAAPQPPAAADDGPPEEAIEDIPSTAPAVISPAAESL
jgi:predicted small lipoprotein YifL